MTRCPVVVGARLEPDRRRLPEQQRVGVGRGDQAAARRRAPSTAATGQQIGERLAFEPAVELLAVQREELAERAARRAASICWSSSTKRSRSRRASRRPIVVLPAPRRPSSAMTRGAGSSRCARDQIGGAWSAARRRGRRAAGPRCCRGRPRRPSGTAATGRTRSASARSVRPCCWRSRRARWLERRRGPARAAAAGRHDDAVYFTHRLSASAL